MTTSLALLVLCAGCAKHSVDTAPTLPHRVAVHAAGPFPTDSAAPGTIRGVVVDDSTGRGLEAVQVFIVRPRREGRGIGAITDRLGRFQFSVAPFDSVTLRVQRIGYTTQSLPVRLDPSRGYAVVLALSPHPVMLCGRPAGPEPAVIVLVRDALSGRAPARGATVKIIAPGYRDSVSMSPVPGDSALVFRLGTFGYFHTYSLIVQSAGFRDWRVDDVGDVQVPCGGFVFPIQYVWLAPR